MSFNKIDPLKYVQSGVSIFIVKSVSMDTIEVGVITDTIPRLS